ncbi:MAG: hypothetical protein AAGI23_16985 [Bacteroidota bacterium]
MQLKLIQAHIDRYKTFLADPKSEEQRALHKWESQQVWQDNWEIESQDLAITYDQSLQNSTTRRIWNRENYAPKKMMLAFLRQLPHLAFFAFQELFNEDKPIGMRVDRFQYNCETLLTAHRDAFPHDYENSHYHDYAMISHYLAFQFPEFYTPYQADRFPKLLAAIGSRDIPNHDDIERHFKVSKTLYIFLKKDQELMELHQQQLTNQYYQGDSLLLVEDFARFIADK